MRGLGVFHGLRVEFVKGKESVHDRCMILLPQWLRTFELLNKLPDRLEIEIQVQAGRIIKGTGDHRMQRPPAPVTPARLLIRIWIVASVVYTRSLHALTETARRKSTVFAK